MNPSRTMALFRCRKAREYFEVLGPTGMNCVAVERLVAV